MLSTGLGGACCQPPFPVCLWLGCHETFAGDLQMESSSHASRPRWQVCGPGAPWEGARRCSASRSPGALPAGLPSHWPGENLACPLGRPWQEARLRQLHSHLPQPPAGPRATWTPPGGLHPAPGMKGFRSAFQQAPP